MARLYKIRRIMISNSQNVFGVTIPNDIAVFFKDVLFKITHSGNSIVLTSGNKPTEEDAKNYKWVEI